MIAASFFLHIDSARTHSAFSKEQTEKALCLSFTIKVSQFRFCVFERTTHSCRIANPDNGKATKPPQDALVIRFKDQLKAKDLEIAKLKADIKTMKHELILVTKSLKDYEVADPTPKLTQEIESLRVASSAFSWQFNFESHSRNFTFQPESNQATEGAAIKVGTTNGKSASGTVQAERNQQRVE
jgi:hypothetical protein